MTAKNNLRWDDVFRDGGPVKQTTTTRGSPGFWDFLKTHGRASFLKVQKARARANCVSGGGGATLLEHGRASQK